MPIGNNAPFALSANARLIAAPAYIGAADIDGCVGLKLTDELIIAIPILLLLLTVGAFAAGSVKPDAEDISVSGQKLTKLIFKETVIFFA